MTTPTVMDLQHDLTNMLGKLEALGSEQQIADYFTQENITGEHLHPFRCPVAQFLHRELPLIDIFCVGRQKYMPYPANALAA